MISGTDTNSREPSARQENVVKTDVSTRVPLLRTFSKIVGSGIFPRTLLCTISTPLAPLGPLSVVWELHLAILRLPLGTLGSPVLRLWRRPWRDWAPGLAFGASSVDFGWLLDPFGMHWGVFSGFSKHVC